MNNDEYGDEFGRNLVAACIIPLIIATAFMLAMASDKAAKERAKEAETREAK